MSAITIDRKMFGYYFEALPFLKGLQLNFGKMLKGINYEQFYEFCQDNPELRIEMTRKGEIIVMPPTFSETGGKNFNLIAEFAIWAKENGTGKGFDSSTGFVLPNGAVRSPDLSWIKLERWNSLTDEQRKGFAHICPDFVVELRSESDSLKKLQAKMIEYIENGASLGWLLDVKNKKVYVYRPNAETEVMNNPKEISGEPTLKGFTLNLKEIWG
ncbi:MAG: Uma2 family endonuclease [Pyrinomonadaceae bacterium]|nr:Uma2 family endonuclease [Pyrinomonadaceae bacterium]